MDITLSQQPRAALYSRGSTPEQTSTQLQFLRHQARSRGLDVVSEYVDVAANLSKLPRLKQFQTDLQAGSFDVLLITSVDRLALTIRTAVILLSEFASRGIHLISIQDGIDTTTEAGKAAMKAITALAAADLALARERGQASVASARRRGSRIGRPRAEVDVEKARALRGKGISYRKVAREMGVGVATVHRALATAID